MGLRALCDASAGTSLYERTGLTLGRTGWRNRAVRGLVFQHRDAAAALGAVRCLGCHRKTAKFQQQFAKTRALFEIHIDEFERHRLRTSATYDRLRPDRPHTVRETERQHRARSKVPVAGANPAAQIEFRDS